MSSDTGTKTYRIVHFFTITEIKNALFPFPTTGGKIIREPLTLSYSDNGSIKGIEFSCNGCRWEHDPHGGDRAEEMLILVGKDDDKQSCEIQISFRESSARLAYYSPA